MRRLCFLVTIVLTCISCHPPRFNDELLRIESYIQSDPACALKELRLMSDSLYSTADKGLYSLLYSMALDKNYIDLKNDSIIRPAIDYFSKHKDPSRSFLSYYYLGRVFENAEKYDQALLDYIKAESFIDPGVTGEYVTRLYSAKTRVYFKQLALDRALNEAYKARAASPLLNNSFFYVRSCLDVIVLLYNQNHYERASIELDSLTNWIRNRGESYPSDYYSQLLYRMLFHTKEDPDSLSRYYSLYAEACQKEHRQPNPILFTEIMLRSKDYDKAKESLACVHLAPSSSIQDSIKYYSAATRLYQGLRDFDNYVASVQESRRLIETMNMRIFNNDVRFLEERYNNGIEREQRKNKIVLLSILVGIILAALATSIVYNRRKQRQLQRAYDEIKGEYAFIRESFNNCGEDFSDVKDQLSIRLQALAPYFQNVPTKPLQRSVLHNLKRDNQEMLRNIGLLYSLSFPDFVAKLVERGLNSEEVGLCSLYASGFVSKELTDIIDSGSVYLINGNIRTKLGDTIDGRTLPAWLRDLFKANKL